MTHVIHSHKRFFKILTHITKGRSDDWWMLKTPCVLDDGVTYRYIPVCESGDEYGSYDDPLDAVHRFAFDDRAFSKQCSRHRRWGMPLIKFHALWAAVFESPDYDPGIRRLILETIGIDDIPLHQRRRKS